MRCSFLLLLLFFLFVVVATTTSTTTVAFASAAAVVVVTIFSFLFVLLMIVLFFHWNWISNTWNWEYKKTTRESNEMLTRLGISWLSLSPCLLAFDYFGLAAVFCTRCMEFIDILSWIYFSHTLSLSIFIFVIGVVGFPCVCYFFFSVFVCTWILESK